MQFRIVGVMAPKGQFLGMDLDDTVFIPTARALELYNREGLMRIHLTYREGLDSTTVATAIKSVLTARHGREDFTLTTQEDMLRTLSKILNVLTMAVGARQHLAAGWRRRHRHHHDHRGNRTHQQIGLLKALGAEHTILGIFSAKR
jgi:putative ABC transport system permease protein